MTIKNGHTKDPGIIWLHKTQDEDKQNKRPRHHLATQDTGRRQTKQKTQASFGYTRHRTKTNKTKDPGIIWLHKTQDEDKQNKRPRHHLATQDTGRRQTKQKTQASFGYTRHRTKTNKTKDPGIIWLHKTQDEDKQNKRHRHHLATQDTGRRQTKQKTQASFGYTRHRTKTNKTKDPGIIWLHKTQDEDKQNKRHRHHLATQDTGRRQTKQKTQASFGYTRHRTKTNFGGISKQKTQASFGYTRHRTKTNKTKDTGIIWLHKTQDEDKQNKRHRHHLATQDTGRRQTKQKTQASFGYTRHRTKTNKTKDTGKKTTKMSNTDPTLNRG